MNHELQDFIFTVDKILPVIYTFFGPLINIILISYFLFLMYAKMVFNVPVRFDLKLQQLFSKYFTRFLIVQVCVCHKFLMIINYIYVIDILNCILYFLNVSMTINILYIYLTYISYYVKTSTEQNSNNKVCKNYPLEGFHKLFHMIYILSENTFQH